MSLTLAARPRTLSGRHLGRLRREGAVPLVLYGYHQQAVSIEADARELERLWHRAGRTTLIDLQVEGESPRRVLFREVQVHPRTGRALHADLFAPNLRVKTTADVPVVLHGEAPAVGMRLGQVIQIAPTVRVECLPTDLPHQLAGDVSGLEVVDALLTAGEIPLPPNVTLVSDPGEVVAKVAGRRVRDEMDEAGEGEAAEEGGEAGGEGAGDTSGEDAST